MELIHNALLLHLDEGNESTQPITQKTQTQAAIAVGRKNLSDLEGLNVSGSKLTRLLLGLGRVFQVMASDPFGHTPEVNQFHIPDSASPAETDAMALLNTAVDHLALVRFPGSKLSDEGDTKDYDYAVHPIFSAYFVFSYRRKRKMTLTCDALLGLVDRPRETIREILNKNGRDYSPGIPEQMLLFGKFYGS
jgi:hypothetical protein